MNEQIKFLEEILKNVNITLNLLAVNEITPDIKNLMNENNYKILDSYEYFYRLKKGIELTLNKTNTNEKNGK